MSTKVSTTTESSGLFSVTSELSMEVKKEDRDSEFYCEVSYFVPGGTRMTETDRISIMVHCECLVIYISNKLRHYEIKKKYHHHHQSFITSVGDPVYPKGVGWQ